ncbi:MAG: recombinase family protein [Actinomycetaceae bacterium]|nr:recombinase family protein [Actinomycetaceae bacterium]
MVVGYIRDTSPYTSVEKQRQALLDAGCEVIYTDTAATRRDPRPGWHKCLDALTSGGTLVVYRLDRLGVSLNEVVAALHLLMLKDVEVLSLEEGLSTVNPHIQNAFRALVQCEDTLRSERSQRSLDNARKEGQVGGRRPALSAEEVQTARERYREGIGLKELSRRYGVAYNTIKAAVRGQGIYEQNVREAHNVAGKETTSNVKESHAGNTTEPRRPLGESK